MPTIIKQAALEYRKNGSDKVWVIQGLDADEAQGTVVALRIWYGRRGTKLRLASASGNDQDFELRIKRKCDEDYSQAENTDTEFGEFERMDPCEPTSQPVIAHLNGGPDGNVGVDSTALQTIFAERGVPLKMPEIGTLGSPFIECEEHWLPVFVLASQGKMTLYAADGETTLSVKQALKLTKLAENRGLQAALDALGLAPFNLKQLGKQVGATAWFV